MPLETAIGEGDEHWDEIAEKVRGLVADRLGKNPEEIDYNARLIEDLGADSLDMIALTMEFEDKYELSIPEKDAEKITTVRQIIDYVFERKYPQNNNLY